MAKQEISDPVHVPSVSGYRNTFTDVVEPESGKRMWETKHIEYSPEGYAEEELKGRNYFYLEKLFHQEKQAGEERTTKLQKVALRGVTIPDLTAVELWKIIGSERPVAIRAKAQSRSLLPASHCDAERYFSLVGIPGL